MTMATQLPADIASKSRRKDRRTHPRYNDKQGLLRHALAALGRTCLDTKNFEVARYTRFHGDVDEDLDHLFSWRFGVPVR
jgi:hypothetical protein